MANYSRHGYMVTSFNATKDVSGALVAYTPDANGFITVAVGDVIRWEDKRARSGYARINCLCLQAGASDMRIKINGIGDVMRVPAGERVCVEGMLIDAVECRTAGALYFDGLTEV